MCPWLDRTRSGIAIIYNDGVVGKYWLDYKYSILDYWEWNVSENTWSIVPEETKLPGKKCWRQIYLNVIDVI